MRLADTDGLRGLYNSIIKPSRNVGYCKKHKCHLTATTLKKRECLRKHCNALDKNLSHDFWRQHEQRKARRRERKKLKQIALGVGV